MENGLMDSAGPGGAYAQPLEPLRSGQLNFLRSASRPIDVEMEPASLDNDNCLVNSRDSDDFQGHGPMSYDGPAASHSLEGDQYTSISQRSRRRIHIYNASGFGTQAGSRRRVPRLGPADSPTQRHLRGRTDPDSDHSPREERGGRPQAHTPDSVAAGLGLEGAHASPGPHPFQPSRPQVGQTSAGSSPGDPGQPVPSVVMSRAGYGNAPSTSGSVLTKGKPPISSSRTRPGIGAGAGTDRARRHRREGRQRRAGPRAGGTFDAQAASLAGLSSSSSDEDEEPFSRAGTRDQSSSASRGAPGVSSSRRPYTGTMHGPHRQSHARKANPARRSRKSSRSSTQSWSRHSSGYTSSSDSDINASTSLPVGHRSSRAGGYQAGSKPSRARQENNDTFTPPHIRSRAGLALARSAVREAASALRSSQSKLQAAIAGGFGAVPAHLDSRMNGGSSSDSDTKEFPPSRRVDASGRKRGTASRSLLYPAPGHLQHPEKQASALNDASSYYSASSSDDDLLSTRRIPPGMMAICRALRATVKEARLATSPNGRATDPRKIATGGTGSKGRGSGAPAWPSGRITHLASQASRRAQTQGRRLSFSRRGSRSSALDAASAAAVPGGNQTNKDVRGAHSVSNRRQALLQSHKSAALSFSESSSEEDEAGLGLPPRRGARQKSAPAPEQPLVISDPPTRAASPVADDPIAHLAMSSSAKQHAMSYRRRLRQRRPSASIADKRPTRKSPLSRVVSIVSCSSSESDGGKQPSPGYMRARREGLSVPVRGAPESNQALRQAKRLGLGREQHRTPGPPLALLRPQLGSRASRIQSVGYRVACSVVDTDSDDSSGSDEQVVISQAAGHRNETKRAKDQSQHRLASRTSKRSPPPKIERAASAVASSVLDLSSSEDESNSPKNSAAPREAQSSRTRYNSKPHVAKTRAVPPLRLGTTIRPRESPPPKHSARKRSAASSSSNKSSSSSSGASFGHQKKSRSEVRRSSAAGSTISSILEEGEDVAVVYISPDYSDAGGSQKEAERTIDTGRMLRAGSAFDRALHGKAYEEREAAALQRILAQYRAKVNIERKPGGRPPPRRFAVPPRSEPRRTGQPPPRVPLFGGVQRRGSRANGAKRIGAPRMTLAERSRIDVAGSDSESSSSESDTERDYVAARRDPVRQAQVKRAPVVRRSALGRKVASLDSSSSDESD